MGLIISGFALVWISQRIRLDFGDVSKTAIILSPLIFYLLVTGKISELEGLGWKAKFHFAVTESVAAAARAADLMIASPEANKPDFFKEAFWGFCRPYYVLTDKIPKDASGKLERQAVINIAVAIRSSIVCGRLAALVVVDEKEKPVGLFRPTQFLEILRIPLISYGAAPAATNTYDQIMASELGVVLENPTIRAASEEAEHLNLDSQVELDSAYQKMIEKGAAVATITDRFGRFEGLITRSAIEGRIIEKLLKASK